MPLPASLLLQPDCSTKAAWAVFDPEWYFARYGDRLAGVGRTAADLLDFYLQSGAAAGHSPNVLFDELYYLSANPSVAALVRAGRYASGFDHYCQIGHRFYSGHWLFDDAFYGGLYEDMSLENLDRNLYHGRYDHYLRAGQFEHRQPHLLFDSRFFVETALGAGDDAGCIERSGAFTHFLNRLQSGAAELPPSVYFDPAWVGVQETGPAIAHYLQSGMADHLDPVPEFSEHFYRQSNPDVRAALGAGVCASGYKHFLQTGVFEFRRPSPEIDLIFYRDANAAVRSDLNTGVMRDAFAHLRAIGRQAGWPGTEQDFDIGEAAAKELFIRKARNSLPVFARRKIDFTAGPACALCIVLVMSGKLERTLQSLASLRANMIGDVQLILVDNGSANATEHIERYVTGAQIIRLVKNICYPRACNLALEQVMAEHVLFLNDGVELGFGAIDAAIGRLRSAPEIGAVGGKVIRPHGMLQEAGCIIRQDGAGQGYMRDASPLAAEANFVRDVDFCSVFLLCQSGAVRNLGGFDEDFSSAFYGDADLCLRLDAAGYRTVYDPVIMVHHLEYGGGGHATQALMRRDRQMFARKHAALLRDRKVIVTENLTPARSADRGVKKILLIEDIVPLRWLGAGYVRANDIVRAIADAGHSVSVFPLERTRFDVASIYSELPENVEVLYDRDISQLGEFLRSRSGVYDLIWVSRTHNLSRILPICLDAGIDPERIPFVLDTEAIGTIREAGRRRLAGVDDFDFERNLLGELESTRICRHCIAVNETEAGLLRGAGLRAVSVLGTMRQADPTSKAFCAREGLLFVAGIHQCDSPNLDALNWYAEEILPALLEEMAEVPVLNVAGYVAPEIDLSAFAGHPHIKIHGPAISLRQHYENNRAFVAPTRFAAGTPYKLYEAASFGLPIVATDLLTSQLGWKASEELLTAPVGDARQFAAQISRVYEKPAVWAGLRENALARIADENTAEAFNENVATILNAACRPEAQGNRSLFGSFSSEKELLPQATNSRRG